MNPYNCFQNKNAVVIGGTSGIGLKVVEKLNGYGAKVMSVGSSSENFDKLNKQYNGDPVIFLKIDISDKRSFEKLSDSVIKEFGKISYLINCAGTVSKDSKGELDDQNYFRLVNTNLRSVHLSLVYIADKLMRKNGAVVNVSSIKGITGFAGGSAAYASLKAGVVNLTKSFALEFAHKFRVNCVAPGATYPTSMSLNWPESLKEAIIKEVPMHRLATPDDIANGIVFLLSDESSFITGQTLNINGGQFMN